MNKTEFVDYVSDQTGMPKNVVGPVLDGVLDGVSDLLAKGEKISFPGFGSFEVSKRAARKGRNPQTGAEIMIAASNSPKFKAGKKLKDAVN